MIFIDTSALVSRYHKKDQFHIRSVSYWQEVTQKENSYAITNLILSETSTLLARRTSYQFAHDKAFYLLESSYFTIFRLEEVDEHLALVLFKKYADQQISFADCITAVCMKKNNIKKIFTFDKHFEFMGFEVVPTL